MSYIRFIIFGFAFYDILKNNQKALKYIYYSLAITLFCLIFDGFVQSIFGKNILGFEKVRSDRLSGLFLEDLVLGSYLSRILLIYLGLIFYFKNDGKYKFYINLIIFILGYILVFLSGERAAFIVITLLIVIFLLSINISLKSMVMCLIISILTLTIFLKNSPTLIDRYFTQFKYHLSGQSVGESGLEDATFMPNYMPMFVTALKMFESKPLFGHGVKSFRYLCDKEQFLTLNKNSKYPVYYFQIRIPPLGKKDAFLVIKDSFFKQGDEIEVGDILFTYTLKDNKLKNFQSNLSGKINKIIPGNIFMVGAKYLSLENPNNLEDFKYFYSNVAMFTAPNLYSITS